MVLSCGEELLVIRYNDIPGVNFIEEHKRIINKEGFVWLGKMGKIPKKSYVESLIKDKQGYILIKLKNNYYICVFNAFKMNIDEHDAYPNYYRMEFLDNCYFTNRTINYTMFFKVSSIREVSYDILKKIVVTSSGNTLNIVLKKSMASIFKVNVKSEITI